MSVLDTLAEIVRNQHLLLARRANNPLHYGALVHLVFMLSERPDMSTHPAPQIALLIKVIWNAAPRRYSMSTRR